MSGFLGLIAGANNAYKDKQRLQRFQDLELGQKQAAQDLQNRVAESQIAENNAQTDAIRNPIPKAAEKGRWKTEAREDGTYLVNDLTGDVKKINVPGIPKPTPQVQPDRTLVQVQQPDGSVTYVPRSQAAGMRAPQAAPKAASIAAPMAAKVGQAGEMIKKAADLLPKMEALSVSLGQSAAQDQATHGLGALGVHIPGTQGVGAAIVSRSPEYAQYQAALTPFVLAAAHSIGGARINDTQIAQIRNSVEIKPGESKASRDQKIKNLVDLVNSIAGSLPPDAISQQEGQMEPGLINVLRGYGYRGGTTPQSSGDINLAAPETPKNQGHPAKPKADAAAILAKYGIK